MSVSQPASMPRRARLPRVRATNRLKVLACYLVCFALPPLWLYLALRFVYPYRLAGTAPCVAQNLLTALPLLESWLRPAALLAADPLSPSAGAWAAALAARDGQWLVFVQALFGLGWLITLLLQLSWRFTHCRALDAARCAARAIRDYRLSQTAVWLVNLAAAACLWLLGVRFVQGFTLWDALVYFVPYGLNGLAALCCFRLAAPPALSGRHGFFKRL